MAFLERLGVGEYVELLAEDDVVDLATLRLLSMEQLRELGIRSMGHRARMVEAASRLTEEEMAEDEVVEEAEAAPEAAPKAAPEAEENTHEESEGSHREEGEEADNENRRGREEPEFYAEEMSTGRFSRRLIIGQDRFYRRNTFKSGDGALSWWHCINKQCKSKVRARYPSQVPSDSAQAAMAEWASGEPPNPSELPSGGSFHGASSLLGAASSRTLRPRVQPSSSSSATSDSSSLPDPVRQRCPVCYKQMLERSIKQHVKRSHPTHM